jgi:hypothetical protein
LGAKTGDALNPLCILRNALEMPPRHVARMLQGGAVSIRFPLVA